LGEKILDVIEQESARLEDVDSMNHKRGQRINAAWTEQKVIPNIIVFLNVANCRHAAIGSGTNPQQWLCQR